MDRQKQIANQAKSFVDEYARTFGLEPETASTLKLWYTLGAQWADSHPPQDTSVLKWKTGKPKGDGLYIVRRRNLSGNGEFTSVLERQGYFWVNATMCRIKYEDVIAWCKLGDIEPYKEE